MQLLNCFVSFSVTMTNGKHNSLCEMSAAELYDTHLLEM